jgi:hypothetical protein
MEEKYLSLYDYLKKAAGRELGKKVAERAIELKIKIEEKEISNPKYSGKILMYPKSFLDNYFSPDLPF